MRELVSKLIPEASVAELFDEGRRYFVGEGKLNKTIDRLSADLKEHEIDYVVVDDAALIAHGYPRFTEDIDLVMTAEGLEKFHAELVGLGYAPAGARKRLRSTIDNVSIEVMISGEYPGDGKPKPVSMPIPSTAFQEIDGTKYVTLEKLIELKLASGISAGDRLKDLADVQELIKIRKLDEKFAERLDPYVRSKFIELQSSARSNDSNQEQE
jgi:hypothetical protein